MATNVVHTVVSVGPVKLHRDKKVVFVEGRYAELSAVEFRVLEMLMLCAGKAISYVKLGGAAQGRRQMNQVEVRRCIVRIRDKIGVHGFITVVRGEGCIIHTDDCEASTEIEDIEVLSHNERALLSMLREASGKVVTYEQLAQGVWGEEVSMDRVYRCVKTLRKKLEDTELLIRCENERGYCLVTRNG